MTLPSLLTRLTSLARPGAVEGMARFGMAPEGRLGVSVPSLRALAREVGRDHALALELWQTGIPEARMLASMIADPRQMTPQGMDAWAADFNSWDVCDQVCDNLFMHTPYAWQKVTEWAAREEEFVRRAAFALLACLAWHDRRASDADFVSALSLLRAAATDRRNYVRKAVNWALRNIGKRNRALNAAALAAAQEIAAIDSPAARWIAADALRELRSDPVQARLAKKSG